MQALLQKHATRRNILILFVAFIVFEILFILLLPSGENAKMIDISGAKKGSEIYRIIEKYDDHIRKSYIWGAVTLDLVFPLVYFLLFSFLLIRFWGKTPLVFLPFFQMIFDLLENAGIVIMLRSWPQQLAGIANTTVIFSWIKWGLAVVSIAFILIGMLKDRLVKRTV
ncbi:MAG: hypothetical protein WCT23_06120 [Candidatus Neomarinimicrobiota bacterium]